MRFADDIPSVLIAITNNYTHIRHIQYVVDEPMPMRVTVLATSN